MNNDQLRAMYNSYGTLNRPQSYGDDLYNDRENIMPSAGQELTQTGTDEAGNPVMAPVEAPEAPRQEQAPLNNLIDFARSRMEQSQDNGIDITAGAGVLAPVVEGMRDLWNATPEERAQMLNVPQRMENAVRGVIHGMSNATELEHTQLYENYFYNPQRKNDEINRISKLLQIDGNAFANDRELYQKAALAADRVERMGKFKKYQDAQGNIDMAKIYADIPGLADIQKQQGTAAAALALGNIDGVRSINDVYNNAFTRFVGSVYAGARRGWISDRRSSIWNDARKENRLPNAEEQKELDAYDVEMRELPKYNYNTVGNVAGAMVGGAFENLAMIVKSQGAGALAGLAAGRLGGAKAANIARNAASTYVMAQMIAGNQYEELVNRTDANGRPVYTPEQASWLALAQGAGEAVLEQYSLNQMGKAIFGRSAAPALRDIIKNSPTLEAAKAGVREYASTKIREATKAGLISLGSEAAEEFNQAASDMLMENVAQVMINGRDAELSSIDDILTNSTGQMLEALPAIGGFGLIGFGANPVANTRAVLGFRSHVRDVVNNKILIGRMANAHYSEVLNGVWDNKKNIKELQDKAPEVAQTILDSQNKIAGIESGFIDVRALRQQEGGEALVQDIAERNNISADELAACLDGSGMLQVKTSTLMQMDLQGTERKAIMDNVTTSLDAFTEAQTKEAVKLAQDQMKSLQNFNDKTYKTAVDNIIAARFPDAEQAKLAREIIETNYDNPQEEFKRRLDAVNAEINEEIEPVLRELRSGMKQGVIFGRDAEGYATGERISNNDPWYSNWYADYGRAPNKRELENLAIDIASGRQDPRYGLPTYQNNTDESREYYAGVAEKLDNLEEQRDALEAIQERMRDLNPGEMVATASLSKEGLKVYDAMRRMMGESENADVQKAGRFNALFLARYADNMAKVFSRIKQKPYTAKDFIRERLKINVNAVQKKMQNAAQMFQVSPAEFERQKAEVRAQYKGTDGWMKAPDGNDTNLTEDQWITVRTPAFKNWFGDWENDPANASKVLDENGEPKVFYHGTGATFDAFDKRRQGENYSESKGAFFFTDRLKTAESYAKLDTMARGDDVGNGNVMPVFLNIKNPVFREVSEEYMNSIEHYDQNRADYLSELRSEDKDGVIVKGDKTTLAAAIEPNQIKDATGRNVGFDPESVNVYLQSAYHGTGARFDRFDTGHIGEGEGAQAHGWGMYFAADKQVAEHYRKMLAPALPDATEVMVNKKQSLQDVYEKILEDIDYMRGDIDENSEKQAMLENYMTSGYQVQDAIRPAKEMGYSTKTISWFESLVKNINIERGTTFEVDIPEDNVLLDEQKQFVDQPKKVQTSIRKLWKSIGYNTNALRVMAGAEIYKTLSSELGSPQKASLALNDVGVKGIAYDGRADGRCFVVFDDKAIKILETYYQQQSRLKGSITENDRGQRLISLFEGADQSTFVHEMAHMFLMDLQEIAGIDPNGREAKDLKTIMDWAEYKPGQADEYKGTASAEEFRRREADIQAAENAGNTLEARRLKDIWAQERFARGFEEYLKSGEAPAQGLKRAFRQFKKWLVQIYNDVLGAGVRATPEVEAIMARMVASEDEIEAMAAANNIARLQKVDPDILSEDAQALRDRWQEEAKERAKEKMLRELMKQYEQQNLKDLDKRLEDVRTSAREELQEMPCFVCEQLLADGTDMASALEICGYGSEQEYRDALQEAGGGMEQALDKMVAQARENMLKEMPSKDALYTMAEEALLSGDYNTRLATLEAEMLKAREASYRNAPARLRRALTEVDEAIKNFETQEVRKAVQKLKYAERWGAKDLQTIQELEKHLADLDKADAKKEEKQKVKEQFEAKYKELKQRTVQNEQWLRDVRDATDGKIKSMRIMARAQMANQQLSAATNPRHWHRQALSEGKKAWQEISRAQRKGEQLNARQAVWAKETQAYFDAMTAEAIKNRQKVDRMLNNARGIKARAKRMADPKFKADANLRYFHNHLLYVYGLRNSDAIAPAQEKTFTDVLAELRASHQFEEEVPAWLIAAAEATTQDKNYQQLTLGEFEELDKLTRVLYTLAKNQNQLLTLDVDMDTVVADCGTDWMNHVDYEVGNQRINDVKGAIGDYMNGLLKPEVLLSIMGGKDGGFIKYIYRVLFKAAEAEEIAREKEAAAQKALYNHYYTQQELRAMVNDPVMVDGPDGTKVKLQIGDDTDITKENLICMALNWGNEANRARLVVGLFDCENDAELTQKQAELMDVLAHTLTEKDWQFVQAMWDHINTFANPVSEVLEKSVGVPLDRVKADAFTVDLPDGQQLNMAGGYYPIVKDSGKSSRQSEFDQMEEAKAVGGVSVFGTGMSATKARTDNLFLNQGPLKLTLDVAHKHIQAQIHLIHAKMAVRDAYKVLNNKAIKEMIRRTYGPITVKTMNEWVLNCWAPPIRPHSWYESMTTSLRSKTVGAIMGYRVSTALLNLANVVYMAQEIGTKNALAAMADFYRHPMENRQAILDVSVFMRNRATNMDRDLGAQEEQFLKRHNMVGNAIDKATGGKSEEMRYLMDKYANWLIEQTDMLVSMPLYQWQFKETYSEEIAKGVPAEEALETANFEATRRVTKVLGSSRAVDSSKVQRSKNEIVKLITPFFTFANTMMNAVWSHYYEGKYTADKRTFSRRYAAFARAILFNFFLGALVETMLRQVPDMLAGSGGDDDDDKFMKTVGKNVLANAAAGFPGINEFINFAYEAFTEKQGYGMGRGVGVVTGSYERAKKVIQDMAKITQGSDKIDAIDFFRDVARAANVKTGMSDTITDAVFNTVRFAADGYSLDNMDDLREYVAKTLFDRKLKKK